MQTSHRAPPALYLLRAVFPATAYPGDSLLHTLHCKCKG